MKGLALCERYFYEAALPVLEKECGDKLMRMAFGLVGEGSDCFGLDDEISRDHDWGPGFLIWLSTLDYQRHGEEIAQIYASLPQEFQGFPARHVNRHGRNRVGVMEINSFYQKFLGADGRPSTPRQWLAIPESALAAAVNGKIFQDPQGIVSAFRRALLRYFPEEVRLYKISAMATTAGQAGQFHYPRSLRRDDPCCAQLSLAKFIESSLSLVFLLNRTYMPAYRWSHLAAATLPTLGHAAAESCRFLTEPHDPQKLREKIEEFSQKLIEQLREEELTDLESDFLPDHGQAIRERIKDEELLCSAG